MQVSAVAQSFLENLSAAAAEIGVAVAGIPSAVAAAGTSAVVAETQMLQGILLAGIARILEAAAQENRSAAVQFHRQILAGIEDYIRFA